MTDLQHPTSHLSRRTIAKGLAWTVPAVAVASAAPAMASSGPAPSFSIGGAVKAPGNSCAPLRKGYGVPITVTNNDNREIEIWQIIITLNTSSLTLGVNSSLLPVVLAPGETKTFWFNATSNSSANTAFSLGIDIYWRHTNETPVDTEHQPIYVEIAIPGTPPDCNIGA